MDEQAGGWEIARNDGQIVQRELFPTNPLRSIEKEYARPIRKALVSSAPALAPAPRVSVIIPAFEAAQTLQKAVRSVLHQTEGDFEILLVDDGSTDGTWKIMENLALLDPRIRAERLNDNGGKARAMNLATAQARGEWIAILDADDWYAPERLERLIAAAEAAGVEMAADNLYYVDGTANLCSGRAFDSRGKQTLLDLDHFLAASNPTEKYDYGMLQPVFRADFLRRHLLDYYEPARIGEDFYQLLCFFAAGGRGVLLDTPLYYYVEPFGSLSLRWAGTARKRYNYERMLEVHRDFAQMLAPQLTPSQQMLLRRREEGIEAMISYHQIRESLRARDLPMVRQRILDAPRLFWRVALKRLFARVKALVWRPKGWTIP